MKNRKAAYIVMLLMALVAAVIWSHARLARMRSLAHASADDLAECYRMSAQIEKVSRKPAVASENEKLANEITGLIEGAAKASQIPTGKIEQITPQAARRLADTVYKEKPTQVILQDVSLRQWVEFLHRLSSSDLRLHVKSLRVTAPRKDDAADAWTGEVEVTYLIYDPPKPQE